MDEVDEKLPEQQEDQQVDTQAAQPDAQPEPEKKHKGIGASMGKVGVIVALLFKLKGIIFLVLAKLKFIIIPLKYLKFGKVFTTFGSMIVTVVIDAWRWGWPFAVGFVLLLFVHEMGHVLAIRAKGMKAGAPVFIPGFGALIAMKEMPHDAKAEAEIGIAGPLLGTAGAVLMMQLGGPGQREIFTRLAYVGFLLNLFNLLPVLPLDGGRVMAAISPKVWLVGLVGALLMFLWSHNPLLLILVILSVGRMWHALKGRQEDLDYYKVPMSTRLQMTVAYFGLAAFLMFMMMELHHKTIF